MACGQATVRRIRPTAGPLLLGVFLLAAQLAPIVHLTTHRNDHTHGPELDHPDRTDHDHGAAPADHDADHAWDHDRDESADHDHPEVHAGDPDSDPDPDPGAAPAHDTPSRDHGRESIAHFGVALLQGPPPPFLPPPSETLALPPDVVLRSHRAAPRRQPPARGPPRLT